VQIIGWYTKELICHFLPPLVVVRARLRREREKRERTHRLTFLSHTQQHMASFTSSRGVATAAATHNSFVALARRGALACVVYVSEGRRVDVIDAIASVAKKTDDDDDDDDDGKRRQRRRANAQSFGMMAKPPRTTREKKVSFGGIQHVEKREEGNNRRVRLVKTFVDEPYNRTGFTFAVRTDDFDDDVEEKIEEADDNNRWRRNNRSNTASTSSKISRLISDKVTEVAQSACTEIGSFQKHSATHPRVGIVDHVSVHPIGACEMEVATEAARAVGRRLGGELGLNSYMYGYATMENSSKNSGDKSTGMRELAEIRRKLGYFSANGEGETWIGASDVYDRMQKWEAKPDFGTGEKVDVEEKGVCCIGAVPFVVNYNVPMTCELSDESQEKLALDLGKQIAKRISQRNEIDGLPNVQSMALMRTTPSTKTKEDGLSSSSSSCSSTLRVDIEIACNLLDEISSTTREQVQKRIEALMPQLMVENAMNGAKLNGAACQIGKGYVTNLQPQDFLDAVSRPRTRS
jgi:glutamate formiminotransferase